MPRRNLIWMLVVVAVGVGLWVWPNTFVRRDEFYQRFSPLLDVRSQVKKSYVDTVDDKVLLRGAIRGMLQELDPFSDYFDSDEYAQFLKRSAGHFVGIGIEVSIVGGYLTVVSPIEDTPAHAAGLRPGDRILEIDGRSTQAMTLTEAVTRIGGDEGTRVRLKIWSVGDESPREIVITRGEVTLHSVKGHHRRDDNTWEYFVDPQAHIGYVRIASFDDNTCKQLGPVLRNLQRQGLRALVLDLRDNPGGLLKQAVGVVDLFIGEGRIVSTKGRATDEEVWHATRDNDFFHEPVAVLINDGSASASEIVAGALRDHGRAVLVGERSFGKGSVQNVIELERGTKGAIKLTTAYYYLPKGERIHQEGVVPDYEVRLTREEKRALMPDRYLLTTTRAATGPASRATVADRQLDKAIEVLRSRLGLATAPATQPATTRVSTVTTRTAGR